MTPILNYVPGGGVPITVEVVPELGHVAGEDGIMPLVQDQSYIDVLFTVIQPRSDWMFIECRVLNTVDAAPLNIWPGIVTDKSRTGFTLQLNGLPDSGNYYLSWSISGATIGTAGAATSYLFSGPVSGPIDAPSTFIVALPAGTTLDDPITIIPDDAGGGGIFNPIILELSAEVSSAYFTYTPVSYGTKTISVNDDAGLADPAMLNFVVVVSTYLFSGPSSGNVSVPSTAFTVALPLGGVTTSTVTIIPDDSGAGGTFTPAILALTTAVPSATFTYTPTGSGGDKIISVTNNRGLTNPANLSYAVIGPLVDGDPVSIWPDSSGNGHDATMTGSNRPIFKTGIIGGKPVVRFTTAGASKLNLTSNISGTGPFAIYAVMKANSSAVAQLSIASTDSFPLGPAEISGTLYAGNRANYVSISTDYSAAFHVILAITDGAGTWVVHVDGVDLWATIVINPLVSTGDFSSIGWRSTGSVYSDGDLAEVIIYNAIPGGTDGVNLEKYLGTKYGITVPFGTAVDPSTVANLVGWWKADSLL